MKIHITLFPFQQSLIHIFIKKTARYSCMLLAVLLCAALFSGCGSSQTTTTPSSSSSDTSEQDSSGSAGNSASTPVTSSAGKASASSSSSAQSDNGYVLPASSGEKAASSAASSSSNSAVSSASSENVKSSLDAIFGTASQADSEKSVADTSGSKISEREYDRIQNGMTYSAVKSIIGGEGKVSREFGDKNSEFYSVTYRWVGNGASGSYAEVTFEKSAVSSKIQFGLN